MNLKKKEKKNKKFIKIKYEIINKYKKKFF